MKPRLSARLCAVLVPLSVLLPASAGAATLIVDAAGAGDFTDVQAAVSVAADGDTVEVRPGVYPVPSSGLSLQGRAILLTSSDGPETTILDATALTHALALTSGEGPDTIISGFTLEGSTQSAIYVKESAPTLQDLVVTGISAYSAGAALLVEGGAPTIEDCRFEGNAASSSGGAVALLNAEAVMRRVTMRENTAASHGGALYASGSSLNLQDVTFEGNFALTGGALSIDEASSATLVRARFTDNLAEEGGAIDTGGQLTAVNLIAQSNFASDGGAITCHLGGLTITNATLSGNGAWRVGGAVYQQGCTTVLTNVILSHNRGPTGGALGIEPAPEPTDGSTPAPSADTVSLAFCDLYQNGPEPVAGITPALISLLAVDPKFQRWIDDLQTDGDDLHLPPTSPVRDAGDPGPAFNDADGSRADLGAYGGPAAFADYRLDVDQDGLPDAWESAHGLDPARNDSLYDEDDDGLTNAQEYARGTLPEASDTDGDGLTDSSEASGGSDPRDAFSPNLTATVPDERFPTLQSALNAAKDGVTLLVKAGTHTGPLHFLGKAVSMRSLEGPDKTTLTAPAGAPVVTFTFGEDSRATLEGFTISGGDSDYGGGVYCSYSSPTLSNLRFLDNYAGEGGALYLSHCQPVVRDLEFSGNYAGASGGAITLLSSALDLKGGLFSGNIAYSYGGAIRSRDSQLKLEGVDFDLNSAGSLGGALMLERSDTRVTDASFVDSEASSGGAISLSGGRLELTRATVIGGGGSGSGGALYVEDASEAVVRQLAVNGAAAAYGGAIAVVEGSSLSLDHATLVGCQGSVNGGALHLRTASAWITQSIVAFNVAPKGGGVYAEADGWANFSFSDVYGNRPTNLEGIPPLVPEAYNLAVDPGFVSYTDDLDPAGDDLHLRQSSPLIDAGDPGASTDPDGTRADIGAYGGAGADFSYYEDGDLDGMADGYETAHGLDPTRNDSAADPDGDGLSNLAEAQANSDPHETDSDHDGYTDREETTFGSDPTDPFSPSGEAIVPDTFSSLQEAIDATRTSSRVRVRPGTYQERIDFLGKPVVLESMEGSGSTVIDGSSSPGPVVTVTHGESSRTVLNGFTIRGGSGTQGGGVQVVRSSPLFLDLIVTENSAPQGAGMALIESMSWLDGVQVVGNSSGDGSEGGGIYVSAGAPSITRSLIAGNSAQAGAGLYYNGGLGQVTATRILGNQAAYGGGVALRSSAGPTLVNVTIHANSAVGGAGIFCSGANVKIRNALITANRAPVGSGVQVREVCGLDLAWSNVWGNKGENYGGDLTDQTGENENVSVDPRYQAFTDDGLWSNDDLHLRPDSPSKDTGDPSIQDPDSSRSDLGAYGGPTADRSYYEDRDGDGMYDGWEAAHGLNTGLDDSALDPDSDSLSNAEEFAHGADPGESDTDGDTLPDAAELAGGSDPTDFFSPNDTVVLNDYFETLKEALDAARDGVTLRVKEGIYRERIDFGGKAVVLEALGAPEKTVIDGEGTGPVVAFRYGESTRTKLAGFTITGGSFQDGGGIRVFQSSPTLERLIVEGNQATNSGGGISVVSGSPQILGCLIRGNGASSGGGIGGRSANPVIVGSTIAQNTATGSGGGVSCVELCIFTMINTIVAHNYGSDGGGVTLLLPATVRFENNDTFGNSPADTSGFVVPPRSGNLEVDPKLRSIADDPLESDLRLSKESPMIDRGQDLSTYGLEVDLDGVPRPLDGDGSGSKEADIGAFEFEQDVDGDGFTPSQGDCDDTRTSINPRGDEVCGDGIDQDCTGEDLSCGGLDQDRDGFTPDQGDCDDDVPGVYPGATEQANDRDDDCDGEIDEGLESPTPDGEGDNLGGGGCSCDAGGPGGPAAGVGRLGWLLLAAASLRRRSRGARPTA